ncbi:MAG: hypothetical protein ACOH5I_14360 [Oligoflexus sp.]
MRSIGTKNLLTLGLLSIASIMLGLLYLYDGQAFSLSHGALFLIAFFALISGFLVVRFGRLDGPSRTMIGIKVPPAQAGETVLLHFAKWLIYIGPNPMQRRLTPKIVTKAAYIYIMAVIGLVSFNDRSLLLLQELTSKSGGNQHEYCQDEEQKEEKPEKIGCDFLLRAYRLGYVKELGNCEPEDIHEDVESQICWLRQKDEPYLHYQWRKLGRFGQQIASALSEEQLQYEKKKLELQAKHLEALAKPLKHAMNHQPRASHHIFTNLPKPNATWFKVPEWLQPNACIEAYSEMSQNLVPGQEENVILQYTEVQLLFQNKHVPAAGFCRDYHLHWDSPTDLCERLAAAPDATLSDLGIKKDVHAVLERWETMQTLAHLKTELDPAEKEETQEDEGKSDEEKSKSWSPQELISFHCFMIDEKADLEVKDFAVNIHQHKLQARAMTLASAAEVKRKNLQFFQPLSHFLAPDFRYHFLHSQGDFAISPQDAGEFNFQAKSYPLTKLEAVFHQDLLLQSSPLLTRADLLEVYPWYRHLSNFVRQFREEYRKKWGRL